MIIERKVIADIIKKRFESIPVMIDNEVSNINFNIRTEQWKSFYDEAMNTTDELSILGYLEDIIFSPVDIQNIESYSLAMGLTLLIPENMIEVFKEMEKQNAIYRLGQIYFLEHETNEEKYKDYVLSLMFNSAVYYGMQTISLGNVYQATIQIIVNIDKEIINGSEFTFKLKDGSKEYVLETQEFNQTNVKNYGSGNKKDGFVKSIPQSADQAMSMTIILKKGALYNDVIKPIIFDLQNPNVITKVYQLSITDSEKIEHILDVSVNIPAIQIVPKLGMATTLGFVIVESEV